MLGAAIVCGGANNQLVHDRIDNRLAERGIVYCPDYLVNAGGVIQVADERHGFSFERAKAKAAGIRGGDARRAADGGGRGRHAERGGRPAGRATDGGGRRRPSASGPGASDFEGMPDGGVDACPATLGVAEELDQAVDGSRTIAPVVERDDDAVQAGTTDRQVDARLTGVDVDGRDVLGAERPPARPPAGGQHLRTDRPRAAERLQPDEERHRRVHRAEHGGGVAPGDRRGDAPDDQPRRTGRRSDRRTSAGTAAARAGRDRRDRAPTGR